MTRFNEITILEDFIYSKGLTKEYQAFRKEKIKELNNTNLTFKLKNYKFKIVFSPDQWKIFKEWSETLKDDFEWKGSFREFGPNGYYKDTFTDVLLTGNDLKTIFHITDDGKTRKYEDSSRNITVNISWNLCDEPIEECRYVAYSEDDDSKTIGRQLVDLGMDYAYDNYEDQFSSIFNIEDK